MSERFIFTGDDLGPAYSAAVDAVLAGDLVVMPTDTVYGVGADAFKPEAVQRLLDAKGRGRDMPPPVLISVVETMDALATSVSTNGRALCDAFWPGALTVICRAQSSLMWDLGDTYGTVALRVPDHESTRELLSRTGPLAVSSANKSGEPAATDVYDAERQLTDSVRVYLDGGSTDGGAPSTIVDLTGDVARVVRLGAISLEQLREIDPDVLGVDDDPADPEFVEPRPADTDSTASTDAVDAVDAVDAKSAAADEDSAAPGASGTEAAETGEPGAAEAAEPEVADPESVASDVAEAETQAAEVVGPETVGPESVEPKPVEASEPEGMGTAETREAAAVESPDPEPVESPDPDPVKTPEADPVEPQDPEAVEEPEADPVEPRDPEAVEEPGPEPVETPDPEPVESSEPESGAAADQEREPVRSAAAEKPVGGKRIDDEPAG